MGKTTKRAIWVAWFLIMCWVTYQLFGWLGVLLLVAAGAIGGLSTVFINRKVRRDEQVSRFRNQPDQVKGVPSEE